MTQPRRYLGIANYDDPTKAQSVYIALYDDPKSHDPGALKGYLFIDGKPYEIRVLFDEPGSDSEPKHIEIL